MTQFVIIADSSVTIQKVIKITLAEGPYSIESCETEAQLRANVVATKDIIIILDVNFVKNIPCGQFITDLIHLNFSQRKF